MTRTIFRAAAPVLAALVLLAGCGGGDGGGGTQVKTVASVQVTPSTATLIVGETRPLTATPLDDQGRPVAGKTVAWSTTDAGRVQVSASGVVTGVALGAATVRATVDGRVGEATVTVGVGAAATLTRVTADGPAPTGGQRILQARVTDAGGSPVAGQAVAWAVASGGGTLSATSTATDAQGVAQVTWTLGTTAGTQTVTAAAGGLSGSPATFTAQAGAGPAVAGSSTLSAGSLSLVAAGTTTLTVQLRDANGNAVSTGGGTVALATTTGSIGPVADLGNGTYTATFTAPTLVGTAAVTGTLNGAALGNALALTINPGAPSRYVVATTATEVTVGQGVTLTARLQDAFGNAVPAAGRTVAWESSAAGGAFSSPTTVTDANGVTAVAFTTGTVSEVEYRLTARDAAGITGTSPAVRTVAGPFSLSTSTIDADPRSVPVVTGTSVLTVRLRDQYGNPLRRSAGTAVISANGGTVGPTTDHGDGTYTATFTAGTQIGNTFQIQVNVNGSVFAGAQGIQITAGPAAKCAADVSTFTQSPGGTQLVVVRVQDQFGNAASGSGRVIQWTSTNGGSFSDVNTTGPDGYAEAKFTASPVAGTTHVLTATDVAGGFSCSTRTITVQ